MKFLFPLLILFSIFLLPAQISARITPEDILNQKRADYDKVFKSYTAPTQQKLTTLQENIVKINKKRTDQLSNIMVRQGEILDEYQRRKGGESTSDIEEARYWVTYAHEAVAYQAAKIYVPTLTGEASLARDIGNTVSLFSGELDSARNKVIHSQQVLQKVLDK